MTVPVAPKIDPDKLDFSQWHPYDHLPLSKRCREHYGGFRRHMWLLWRFKWDMRAKVKKITHCIWGKHSSSSMWKRVEGEMKYRGEVCCWCYKRLPSKDINSRRYMRRHLSE